MKNIGRYTWILADKVMKHGKCWLAHLVRIRNMENIGRQTWISADKVMKHGKS